MNNKRRTPFDFCRKPKKPTFLMGIAKRIIAWPDLKKRGFTYEKMGMDDINPPFLLLSTHGSMVDFGVMLKLTHPYPVNNVMTLEGFHDYTEFIMRNLGVLGKRKFIKDVDLIKNINYCLKKLGTVFVLYPEARYSLDGTTSFLPESLAKLCKMMRVPVVMLNQYGNFVTCPQWNKKDKGKAVHATMRCLFTEKEIKEASLEDIEKAIREAFVYDDFAWQKEQKLVIDDPGRADGLHSILYQCPHCQTEFQMHSQGTRLWCESCGKGWQMTELGELKAEEGEDYFSHIPDWFSWERENVQREIAEGTYHFEDAVHIETLPNAKGFLTQPDGMLRQDCTGTYITGTIYGKPFCLEKKPSDLESMHVEYDYHGKGDCVDISVAEDSYWCYPLYARDVISKLSIATEELYMADKKSR